MSQENVEIVNASYEAWNAGDTNALRELYHPDVILRTPEGWLEPGPFVGRQAVMGWLEEYRETWDNDTVEPIDFIDAADRVAVRSTWRAVGHGPEAILEATAVFTLREGRIFGVEFFGDHTDALEDWEPLYAFRSRPSGSRLRGSR